MHVLAEVMFELNTHLQYIRDLLQLVANCPHNKYIRSLAIDLSIWVPLSIYIDNIILLYIIYILLLYIIYILYV